MNVRQMLEKDEHARLDPKAAFSDQTRGRPTERVVDENDVRTNYQRDIDRIVHCKSFRRLMHKTQVFFAAGGGSLPHPYDPYP